MVGTNHRVKRRSMLDDKGLQLHLCRQLNTHWRRNIVRNNKLNICSYSTIGKIHHHGKAQREDGSSFYSVKLTQHAQHKLSGSRRNWKFYLTVVRLWKRQSTILWSLPSFPSFLLFISDLFISPCPTKIFPTLSCEGQWRVSSGVIYLFAGVDCAPSNGDFLQSSIRVTGFWTWPLL